MPGSSQFMIPKPLERNQDWVPLKKGSVTWPKIYTIKLASSYPQWDLQLFSRTGAHWGRRNTWASLRLLDTHSKRTLILDIQRPLWSTSQTTGFQGQVINVVSHQGPSDSGPSVSTRPLCGHFPSSRMHNWHRHSEGRML